MTRFIIFCSGLFLSGATGISAQNLPKHPSPQQVVSYRVEEQQRWNSRQLLKNSILYKNAGRYPGSLSFQYTFKKEQQPVIDLSSIRSVPLPGDGLLKSSTSKKQLSFLNAGLLRQKQLYSEWQKQNWLRDIQGSMLLREFLMQSKTRNSVHL